VSLLAVHGASKFFGGLKAVHRVSFDLSEGEMLGLIGPNGAGKTTLFHVISGFLKPDEGSVSFAGESLAGLRPHDICQRGMVRTFQIARPFLRLSVLENRSWEHARVGHGRLGRRPLNGCTPCSRGYANGVARPPARCRAASSKWWPSGED